VAELLRETFEEYGRRAPAADGLADAVAARVRRERARRRRWTVAGAALAAASVVAAVSLVSRVEEPRPTPPATGSLVVEPPAPEGTRWLVWRGLRVALPVAWFETEFDACGEPQSSGVVVNDRPGDQCASAPAKDIDLLWVFGTHRINEPSGRTGYEWMRRGATRTDLTIDGVAAQRIVGRSNYTKTYAEGILVPGREASLVVTTPEPGLAKVILDTVRIDGEVDARGCEVRRTSLHATAPPARPGATERMVPDGVVQASVCRYGGEWAIVSKLLDGTGARGLADAMNALAPSDLGAEGGKDSAIVVTFRYPSGPDVEVYVHVDGPRDVGVTNGAVTAGLDGLESVLKPVAGWRWTYEQERL